MSDTIEVHIRNKDHVKFLDWVVIPELGLELLLQKVMGATKEQREEFMKRLDTSGVSMCISEDSEYTLIATMYKAKLVFFKADA
ncbi:hypothetical protein HWC06_gp85 [Gordonia phage Duffington]|uniref:Uncharacterized protein n=1 Tax=Gordonia phage Duffington TaxID=2507858 RepID=A0A410TCQ1_9CAUD|nr:hypothetical protein HWC06_gp85 [Gordonia phage Duffington]QAU06790.1 hypothetical protein SEA_DUFFINGTON_85 [Gordonia phage Duffington]